LGTCLLLCALAALPSCRHSPPPLAKPPSPASWMEDHLAAFGDRTLGQLTLPASHDAGMYQSGFPQLLGRTQNVPIFGQLSAGVRYFDVRPGYRNGDFYVFHGAMIGPPLTEVLGDVQRFMSQGHRELVILKLSHDDGFSSAVYSRMIDCITASLGPWLFTNLPAGKRLVDVTLKQYVANHGSVLVLCDGNYPIEHRAAGVWVFRDWDSQDAQLGDLRVYDQYSNTMSRSVMEADQLRKFVEYDGRCRNRPDVPCDLFLLSWTLTPPTDVLRFAESANRDLPGAMSAVKMPNCFGQRINLLYTDASDTAVLAELAVSMNGR
jgi:hypothetical protein